MILIHILMLTLTHTNTNTNMRNLSEGGHHGALPGPREARDPALDGIYIYIYIHICVCV